MLEKDVENLLARYPGEFFSKLNLTLIGQQIRLGSYFADIIFENEIGEKVVIEVKRGILPRDAVGQNSDYYGAVKQKEPTKNIQLVIVANVIPKERTVLLSERLGIKFIEIPVSKIKRIATKYSYTFLDMDKPERIKTYLQTANELDYAINSEGTRAWIFQANPKRYDILNALSEIEKDTWLINQHYNEIRTGDKVVVWMSGKEGGIYAIAEITSDPNIIYDSEASGKYWLSLDDKKRKRLRVKIKYQLKLLNNPIMKEDLRNIPELRNMSVFRQPQATNFPVSNSEWNIISRLIKERLGS